jgi:hypothetical protein
MEQFTYPDLLQHLDGFDAWLTSLDCQPEPTLQLVWANHGLRRMELIRL